MYWLLGNVFFCANTEAQSRDNLKLPVLHHTPHRLPQELHNVVIQNLQLEETLQLRRKGYRQSGERFQSCVLHGLSQVRIELGVRIRERVTIDTEGARRYDIDIVPSHRVFYIQRRTC